MAEGRECPTELRLCPGECPHPSHRAEHPPGMREDEEKPSSPCTTPFPGQVKLRIVTTRSAWKMKNKKKINQYWVSNLCLAARRELGLGRGICGPGPCCSCAASTSDNFVCLHLPSIPHLHCCEELTDCSQREICFALFWSFFFFIQTIQF